MTVDGSTVLVTGASGMLGGAVARALVAGGAQVRTFQRRPARVDGARDVLGSVTDPVATARAVAGCDAVVHLAARVDITGPEDEFRRVNVEGTRHLLAAARAAGAGRFVHVSSPSVAHVGGSLVGAPATAAEPALARGPYARTKAAGELLALETDTAAMRVVVVRPHLVWGPGDTQLIGRVVARARAGRLPVLGSGAPLIDTTYVDNAADALVAALTAPDAACGQAYVVTNGEPRPVLELLRAICVASGAPAPRVHVPGGLARALGAGLDAVWARFPLAGEPPLTRFVAEQLSTAHWFDQRRTREALRWSPRVSLDEGFARLAAAS
ncbi:nucleoside-diphosphate sugar epimerase [Cellulomonas chitinilytica]|uniref:Nucleoside-diphosphate sugar epimerase n=1 Tax=Cellulomonas chitinilytica TaxID=398759 RepID=A0A919P5K7_9CELL|nr:NAD-dependent epimerase/dehydratase family protein [Cellulomonas chitinilytica]GIG23140.1 nucleoside-diphosphate sugar epimerase [Cellulomonas chitinilytica]